MSSEKLSKKLSSKLQLSKSQIFTGYFLNDRRCQIDFKETNQCSECTLIRILEEKCLYEFFLYKKINNENIKSLAIVEMGFSFILLMFLTEIFKKSTMIST